MNCPCDVVTFPQPVVITPGRSTIPRQIATFPEYRAALLDAVRSKRALDAWSADVDGDLGLMLLEMAAYLFDAVSFYDEVIAHECYVRTARLPASLRALVARLGYVAKPAVGGGVHLVAFAEGRRPLTLPQGTAFRSGAFGGNPPQVFELDAPATISPLNDRWTIARTRDTTIAGPSGTLLLDGPTSRVRPGDLLVVSVANGFTQTVAATAVAPRTGIAGDAFVSVTLDASLPFAAGTPLSSVTIRKPTSRASLWNIGPDAAIVVPSWGVMQFTLDRVNHRIKPGDTVMVTHATTRAVVVNASADVTMHAPAQAPTTTTLPDNKTVTVTPAAPALPATRLSFDWTSLDWPTLIDWSNAAPSEITIRYGLVVAGTLAADVRPVLDPHDQIVLNPPVETFDGSPVPARFMLSDVNERAVEITGALHYTDRTVAIDTPTLWTQPLAPPVTLYGNVLAASRGESVANEVLGTGDGALANQAFALKKSPLTYTATPSASTAHGFSSTLMVLVDGVRWDEVPNFVAAGPSDAVYVVRARDDGTSVVTFGDGANGMRLPSGALVHASYRYGAGAADPPALSVRQLAKPVPGLRGVRNPLAAFGGADAESPLSVRTLAPRSALLLGRAVSIDDMEVVAAQTPGVVASSARWAWSAGRQRPLVQIWYIGASSVAATIEVRLRALSDPAVEFDVATATAVPATLALDVQIEARRRNADLKPALMALLADPASGIVMPARLGIGATLFVSALFDAVLAVTGTLAVTGALWNGAEFATYGVNPGGGAYFDLTAGVTVKAHGGIDG